MISSVDARVPAGGAAQAKDVRGIIETRRCKAGKIYKAFETEMES